MKSLSEVEKSLSARRAWIEKGRALRQLQFALVALRKESVDRKYKERPGQKARPKSLSARRAWIENIIRLYRRIVKGVALRKESVDRKRCWQLAARDESSRSPQGERG